ncbi:hypothetical protein [Mixta gaviniae]|uniref:Uncharacterized protein n=1 Tax=Mixta gaviniae TaxID=665914 RepID=A0A1X1E2A7_9GAMM|nr:hypothetical protein [Mixta gaviniae]AUX93209.1 hypothetical protein C2E15_09050 [Mixta gaviniae]ORM83066.1 hypothetical protein HA44_06545 [Mixta gaviniae]
MLRDHLEIHESDTLERVEEIRLKNRGQEAITKWSIKGPDGDLKGLVTLFDKFCTRRSWPVNYRITQHDSSGKVVVDKLTDSL